MSVMCKIACKFGCKRDYWRLNLKTKKNKEEKGEDGWGDGEEDTKQENLEKLLHAGGQRRVSAACYISKKIVYPTFIHMMELDTL